MPNVVAMAKEQACGNSVLEKQLLDYADTCVKPEYDYFKVKFNKDLKLAMNAFKAARFFFLHQRSIPCSLLQVT